jgi:hypothetical protein
MPPDTISPFVTKGLIHNFTYETTSVNYINPAEGQTASAPNSILNHRGTPICLGI